MPRNPVLTFRVPQSVFNALDRERHLRHLNVSRLGPRRRPRAFQRDFPNATRYPLNPISAPQLCQLSPGSRHLHTDSSCAAGGPVNCPKAASAPATMTPPHYPTSSSDSRSRSKPTPGQRLRRWIHAVVERSDDHVYVRDGLEKP